MWVPSRECIWMGFHVAISWGTFGECMRAWTWDYCSYYTCKNQFEMVVVFTCVHHVCKNTGEIWSDLLGCLQQGQYGQLQR